MSALEAVSVVDELADYVYPIDYEGEVDDFSLEEILAMRGLLAAAEYIESGSVAFSRRPGGNYSVANLVRQFASSNPERLESFREREAVVGPYIGYDEKGQQTVPRDGITIYTRQPEGAKS